MVWDCLCLDRQVCGRPSGMKQEFSHLPFEFHESGKIVEGVRPQIPVAADDQGDPPGVFPAVEDEVLTAALKDPRGQHVFCIGGIRRNEEARRTILSRSGAEAGRERTPTPLPALSLVGFAEGPALELAWVWRRTCPELIRVWRTADGGEAAAGLRQSVSPVGQRLLCDGEDSQPGQFPEQARDSDLGVPTKRCGQAQSICGH